MDPEQERKRRRDQSSPTDFYSTTAANQRLPDNLVPLFRALRKLRISEFKCDNHIEFLSRCESRNFIPKGLNQNKTQPQTPTFPTRFLIQWETAHQQFGKSLTKILLDYWKYYKEELTKDIASVTESIENSTSDPDSKTNLFEIIDKLILDFKTKNINRTNAKKISEKNTFSNRTPRTNNQSI